MHAERHDDTHQSLPSPSTINDDDDKANLKADDGQQQRSNNKPTGGEIVFW
jgi:hypothetical protein